MVQNQEQPVGKITFSILIALSLSHCLNDLLQSVVSAAYPLFKDDLGLSFAQIGLITLVYQLSASVFQPITGIIFDKYPVAWSLPIGMSFTLIGLINLAFSDNLYWILASVFLIGIGSSVLHPEASRITFLASGIGTALVGLLIAIPCLRLATDFLSLITIAFSYVFLAIVRNWMSVTKGPQGIPGISCINFFGIDFKDSIAIYFVLLAITVLSYIIISNITKSKFGRAMQATRDDELGARSAGIKPNQIKILSFVIGTFFAGLAGALYAAYIGYIGPNTFTFDTSTTIFQMCILGGLGSIPGAIVGTVFFVVMPEAIRTLAVYRVGVGGIIMLLLMLFRPQGIMGSRAFATKDGLQERLKNWLIARRVTKETAQRQE